MVLQKALAFLIGQPSPILIAIGAIMASALQEKTATRGLSAQEWQVSQSLTGLNPSNLNIGH
jgi:hypothetical protein